MFLLKHNVRPVQSHKFPAFTFHNVSIKTAFKLIAGYQQPNLHSTIFLLKRWSATYRNITGNNLHSTIFLLKPILHFLAVYIRMNLHSTMFLLKLHQLLSGSRFGIKFTFHNVSIKTTIIIFTYFKRNTFTFHNVSIKTQNDRRQL